MWAMLFPGQGSQKVGMGLFYYKQFKTARRLFEEASDELHIDFKKLCFEGPLNKLTQTQNTQPAILLVSTVAWACLSEEVDLSFVKYSAGHSVGEYSALVASRVLSFKSALRAVHKRGIYMSDPSIKGGMGALIGPSAKEAKAFCKWANKNKHGPLEVANFNSPEQNVLSGSPVAIKWVREYLKQAHKEQLKPENLKQVKTATLKQVSSKKYIFSSQKVRFVPLKVSAPFHSSLMKPARQKMAQFLKTISFKEPDKIVVQNSTAQSENNPQILRKNLVNQVTASVLWLDSIRYLFSKGCSSFLELGEGEVLSNLMKKTDPSKKVNHFHSLEDIKKIQASNLKPD